MTPLACVLKLVKDDATLAATHGGRVSENSAPQGTAFPRVVMEAVSRTNDITNDGPSDLHSMRLRLQFQAKAKGPPEAMRTRTRAILNGLRGSLGGSGGITVQGAFEEDASDEFDEAINEGEAGVFVVAAEYDVIYTITP
jgi:hypothetical protein